MTESGVFNSAFAGDSQTLRMQNQTTRLTSTLISPVHLELIRLQELLRLVSISAETWTSIYSAGDGFSRVNLVFESDQNMTDDYFVQTLAKACRLHGCLMWFR